MAAAAIPHVTSRHLVYLDDQRTHEVHAQVALAPGAGVLATTEFPVGSRDGTEALHAEAPVRGEDDLRVLLRELEDRLSMSGRYWRADVADMRWVPLPPATRPPPDLRAHEVPLPGATSPEEKLRFHHFHQPRGRERLLVSMPRPELAGRHVLAELTFDFPHVDQGDLDILHTRLTAATLRSSVLREHVEAPRKGFEKLVEPQHYQRAFGDGWLDKTRGVLRKAATRFLHLDAQREPPPPAPTPARRPPDLERMAASLGEERVASLVSQWVTPADRARLVAGGEHVIRRHVNALRRRAGHLVAYDLSVVEAALLLEYAIPAQMWDLCEEQGAKLLRYARGAL